MVILGLQGIRWVEWLKAEWIALRPASMFILVNTTVSYKLVYVGQLLSVSVYAYMRFTMFTGWCYWVPNAWQTRVQNSHDFTKLVDFHQEYANSPLLLIFSHSLVLSKRMWMVFFFSISFVYIEEVCSINWSAWITLFPFYSFQDSNLWYTSMQDKTRSSKSMEDELILY